ncbi:MAG: hypothetical protein ACI3Z9_06080 [Candidatus Onthomorpha sp.]
MKKLLFAVFVLLSQIGFSQQLESAIITNPNHSDYDYKQLVRVFDENRVIVSSCENGQYSFYLLDNGNISGQKVEITSGDTIIDFCITEDEMVYFCSRNVNCYVGRFSFNAFFNQDAVEKTLISTGIDTLSKIKTYKDPSCNDCRHVVVLGEAGSYSIILDLNNVSAYPNWECNVAATTSTTEKWKDIDFDDDYLVVAGLDGNSLYMHYLKRVDLNPVVGGYFTNPLGIAYNTGTLFLKHLYDYKYVTVSDVYFLPKGVYTYCQIFDLPPSSQITFEYERTLMHPQKNIIRDIEYSKDDNELLVLMSSGDVGSVEWKDFLAYAPLDQSLLLPMQIYVMFLGNYDPKYPYFNSVRMYKPYNYILAGVEPIHNTMLLFAKDKTLDISTSCNKYADIKMSGSDVGTTATPSSNFYHTSFSITWGSPSWDNPSSETFNLDCHSTN